MSVAPNTVFACVVLSLVVSCGSDEGTNDADGAGEGGGSGVMQTPPTGATELEPWLAAGHYLSWNCEPGPVEARPNGAHGKNRVCSNDLLSAHGNGEYPVGAASVKEIYDAEGRDIEGLAVSLHVTAGQSGGDWYWFEKLGGSVAADGKGEQLCVGCHEGAGSDAEHQGHDFVYIQVP